MGEKTRRRWPLMAAAAMLVAALVIAGVATIFVRGGIAHPADRARAEAEDGYAQWSDPFAEEAAARQAALEPLLGEPIAETWYIICSGIAPGGPVPTAQVCSLEVQANYAIDWTDPHASITEMITALEGTDATTGDEVTAGEGGPWKGLPRDVEDEPGGKVAEAGAHGSVVVYDPAVEIITLDNLPPVDLFGDGVLTEQTVEASEPPAGHGQVWIRRQVGISRTNIGCVPQMNLACGTLLEEAAMPRVDGFR